MDGRSKARAGLQSLPFLFGWALALACASNSRSPTATENGSLVPPQDLGDLAVDLAGLRVDPRAAVVGTAPTYLEVVIPVTNATDSVVTVEYGACAVGVLLYRDAERRGDPAWDWAHRTSPQGHTYACPLYLKIADVQPGETHRPHEFRSVVPIYEILGNSLPAGRYYVTALFNLNRTEVRLDLGPVDLSRDYGRLPAERIVDGVLYRVETVVHQASPAHVEMTVVRTNVVERPVEVALDPGVNCPIYLSAYHNASERDAAPLGSPDWSASFGCELGRGPLTLEPGETDRSVRFDFLSPEIPAGEWHFALGLHTSAPWPEGSVLLSAGRATLNR